MAGRALLLRGPYVGGRASFIMVLPKKFNTAAFMSAMWKYGAMFVTVGVFGSPVFFKGA